MTKTCQIIIGLFVLSLCLFEAMEGSPDPGRKKTSSGTSWFGSKKKETNNNNWSNNGGYGNNNYGGKKKSSSMKTLKKAAVIGVAAYGGYQLGKLTSGYGNWGWGRQHGYGFNDWNRWREIDGFLCRRNEDCNWIDQRLYCQDYELDFRPSALWFGGDVASIVGECACPHGMYWDNYEMYCKANFFGGIASIIGLVIGILVLLCCCGGAFFIARKML